MDSVSSTGAFLGSLYNIFIHLIKLVLKPKWDRVENKNCHSTLSKAYSYESYLTALKKVKQLCHSFKVQFLIGLMRNHGFRVKCDFSSLLQSKLHSPWTKLNETILLKTYFHFKPEVSLSRDYVTSRQIALFEFAVRHYWSLASKVSTVCRARKLFKTR